MITVIINNREYSLTVAEFEKMVSKGIDYRIVVK